MPGSQSGKQSPANAAPPESRMDRQIQQLGLTLREAARYGESHNGSSANRHDEIVSQIVADVPLGGLGGCRLHFGASAGGIAGARRRTAQQRLRVQTGPRPPVPKRGGWGSPRARLAAAR